MAVSKYVLPGDTEEAVAGAVQRAADERVYDRIGARDATLWGPEGTPEVADRLGWLDIASRVRPKVGQLDELIAELSEDAIAEMVLLGMGGSSLAPETFRRAFGQQPQPALDLYVLDTTEPLEVLEYEQRIFIDRTLFVVASKSGGTIEPNALLQHFWEELEEGDQFVTITDPDTKMVGVANELGFRTIILNDPNIGGRYSALSWFGVVPARLAGYPVEALLDGAIAAEQASEEDSGLWLGAALGGLADSGRDKLAFVIDAPLEGLGLWAEQLIAESTGKQGKGVLPIADEPIGDDYGDDRVFLHIRNTEQPDAGNEAAVAKLAEAGHPVLTMDAQGPTDLGRVMYELEYATAVLGWALGINPFDQPNVQEAKDNTQKVLEDGPPELEDGELSELLDGLAPPHYFAIMGFLPYRDDIDAAVARLRAAVMRRYGVATTWGYGPRFLHSTGQYHKGGPPTGRFLQLVHDDDTDADVPDEGYDFRELISAQADGDLQTLRDHGLTAVRVRLSAGDLAGSIDRITKTIEGT